MIRLSVMICRFVDEAQPGWVECRFTDAHGRAWSVVEKAPIVTAADLDASSHYPQPGSIDCRVVERRRAADGRELVAIDIAWPWSVEATSGETCFEVLPEQLADTDHRTAADR